ncbi:Centrosomal protein [Liparis tanakae]|uniref:Centrosomal protein n=1 Tax=Liparis tanakae TaxID=230148 RepID=A0A4Z2I0S9_9TELE|nr:Centrosomal protein [Liparis tanakae]
MHIPEEALKHEKFSSQLQLSRKRPPEVQSSKCEVKVPEVAEAPACDANKPPEAGRGEDKGTGDGAAMHKVTPLYGQPAWWGDGDRDKHQPGRTEEKSSDRKPDKADTDTKKSAGGPKSGPQTASSQEPSYFEIPTKDTPSAGKASGESPSREPEAGGAEPVHGHASFTIEFDPGASGKATAKDRAAKVGPETRPRPKRGVGEELSPLQTAMVAAEVKVADWLAQNELPLAMKDPVAEDDGESSKHEDGTQSDSENALGEHQRRAAAMEQQRSWGLWGGAGMKIREGRANVPEGLFAEEDSPARRRKTSASKAAGGFLAERRRGEAAHQQSGREECYHHGDDYSDRGTYTIDVENGDREEEEARKMIDKVFGVDEQEAVCVSGLGVADPGERLTSQRSGMGDRGKPGRMETEAAPEQLMVGGPRWVSQWATLAASHIRTDPEGSGGESHVMASEDRAEISESSHSASFASSGYTERKRRALPQLPGEELALGRRTPGAGLLTDMGEKQDTEPQEKESREDKTARGKTRPGGGSPGRSSPAKSQDSARSGALAKLPPRPLTSGEKRMEEVRRRKKEEEKTRESSGKPLLRQESFTVEKSSSNIELIPRIDGLAGRRTQSKESGVDGASTQKDSDAVAAFLETTVSDQGDPPSQSIEGSVSPESDVDTASTVSQAGGARKVIQKRRILAGQQKERTPASSSGKGPAWSREAPDRRVKTRASGPPQPSRTWTSLDLTDDDVNSNSLLSDSQHTSRSTNARAQTGSTKVGASTKASRAKTSQAPSSTAAGKTANAPKPRPTRASLLRRARMGDSSDTEPAEFDRMSVASEASTASSTSRTGMARRGMSRIEALAQPRRPRVGSPSAQSDSEATVTRRGRGLGPRSTAGDYALRQGLRGSGVTSVSGPRARANSASKLPDKNKGPSSHGHVPPATSARWRRVPVEYASTSEDEYGSNRHLSKQSHARPFPATRVAQLGGSVPATPTPGGISGLRQNSREQDEYMRDWTAHSEEIARISQDLAKDLAMLAREIHDVAGEIDSVSPAATDPGAPIEERVFEDSLDLSGPPAEPSGIVGTNGGESVELRPRVSGGQSSRSIRRQTWNRDDAVLDSLLIASVNQLSTRIRHSVDKTTSKIRILFKDKEQKWEEIENKVQVERDSLLLRSSNKVTSTHTSHRLSSAGDVLKKIPLAEHKIGPGTQQGSAALHTGGSSGTAPRATESSGPLDAAERDAGPQKSARPYK